MKKQLSNLILGVGLSTAAVAQTSVTGPSSSQSPYLQPLAAQSTITSIFTATQSVNGYTMAGLPDGLGAYDNGDGTFTVLMNHEMGNTVGAVHAHGSTGTFVSKWVINKTTLAVVSGQDLIQDLNLWMPSTSTYTTYNSANSSTVAALGRFCSGDLAAKTAYFNAATGKGTQERIFLNGEETGSEGRAFAHIATGAAAGTSYELPYLGKASWENYVASPYAQDKTIVIGMDDATPGQVYVYVGTKQTAGTDIVKAGLSGGKLYGVAVLGLLNEGSGTPAANTTFNLLDLGSIQNATGATLNTNSNNVGVTNFLRPEDGAWDPANPRDFYFVTTNSFSSPSRLWRLRFNDIKNPELGGTITALLNGTEGQKMLDNIGINSYGQIMLQEDVGGNIHNGKIWQYNTTNNSLSLFAQHDTTRFITGAANFLTIDEESSGMIDAQEILGPGMWLFVDQAHYSIPGAVAEGGQLLALYNKSSANANPEVNVQGNTTNIAINSTVTSSTNNTNYGSANLGQSITKTFVIQNAGPGVLSVSGVSVGGINAGDFSLLSAPLFPYTVAVNGTLTIYVQFSPGTTGLRKGMVTIMNNDFDESNYAFAIEGSGVVPEINVNGNSASIADGNTALSLSNNTDFGSTFLNVPIIKTFEIQNTGTGTLNISNISINGNNSSEFTFVNSMNFPSSLNASGNYTFAIQYLPQTLGTRTAVISVMSDDSDESNYDFMIGAKTLLDVGVANYSAANMNFVVFPNPANDQATVRISSETTQTAHISVVDLQGKVVIASSSIELTSGTTESKLNTSNLAAGEYIVVLNANKSTSTLRLVITR